MGLTACSKAGLPKPSGKYPVGAMDVMTEHSADGVFFRLYYPALNNSGYSAPKWIPRPEYINGYAKFLDRTPWQFRLFFRFVIGNPETHALWNATLIPTPRKLPVVVFSHGLGGMRTTYSAICTEIASHGFIVAAVEHRDKSACWSYYKQESEEEDSEFVQWEDVPVEFHKLKPGEKEFKLRNPQLHKRVSECVRSLHLLEEMNLGTAERQDRSRILMSGDLTQFQNRMDLSKVAVAGHSFGGATAIATLAVSTDFQAGLILDGWMFPIDRDSYAQVQQPLIFINTEAFHWKDNIERIFRLNSTSPSANNPIFTIKGSVHQSQTDFTYLVCGRLGKFAQTRGSIAPHICNEINNRLSMAFLRSQLGMEAEEGLEDVIDAYPEWLMKGTNVDMSEEPQSKL